MKKLILASLLLAAASTYVVANGSVAKAASAVVNSDGSSLPPWH